VYDEEENLLDENPIDAHEVERRKKISTARNKFEDLIQQAKGSTEGMDFVVSCLMNMQASLHHIAPTTLQTRQEEYEGFIGCQILEQINILPLTNVLSKGRSKRIKKSKELPKPRKRKNASQEAPAL
jgi:hypothetical protein